MKSPIQDYLEKLLARHAGDTGGKVADYIPELSKANPNWFGICLATIDGHVYEVGDSRQHFTIQSISKPFVYGVALEDNGRDTMLRKVGVEPTGDAFNSISLDPVTGQPANPMINAGAIATTSLVDGATTQKKMMRILEVFGRYVGHDLEIDESVYRSEAETGHRNRAISHLLRNFEIIPSNPEVGLDAYFRQCSIKVTCRDLAMMAATLANHGVNPVTGKRALLGEYVGNVLGVMTTCGMYDFAGAWIYRVGLPAKSGVGGGIIAVLPGQLGIGIFSPPLDHLGNSVRGIKVCEDLSCDLHLHMLRVPSTSASVIRRSYDGATIHSNRLRSERERKILTEEGQTIQVIELQGELHFASMEKVVREGHGHGAKAKSLILNFRHVLSVSEHCIDLLAQLCEQLQGAGCEVTLAESEHLRRIAHYFRAHPPTAAAAEVRVSNDLDEALEFAENQLLKSFGRERSDMLKTSAKEFTLCQDFADEEIAEIEALLKPRSFAAGTNVLSVGDPTTELLFLRRGKVTVLIENPDGTPHRVATYTPGMAFGEVAFLDRSPRSAAVRADTDIECALLEADDFDGLALRRPALAMKLLRNIAIEFSHTLRRSNAALRLYRR